MSSIREIFSRARSEGRTRLTETEAKQVLHAAGIRITRENLAATVEDAVRSADAIGYPVVLKVVSPDILHKTEAGGIRLNVSSAREVRQAYGEIIAAAHSYNEKAKISGVSVQEMVTGGVETLVGLTNYPPFGPTLAFGLGGVYVELLKDVTFRLAPIDADGASEMIDEIAGRDLLDGYRGQPAVKREELAGAITRLADLAVEFVDEIEELDVNPLLALPDGAIALDALITLKETPGSPVAGTPAGTGSRHGIQDILEPKSIAVVGASSDPAKTGHVLFKNILTNGYPGKLYPINPNADEILGVRTYPDLESVPGEIDMVFFLLPGRFVSTLFKDCQEKGVKAACIIAAGFAEVGEEGRKAQEELERLVRETGVRCLGPNSIGMINMDQPLMASFVHFDNWRDGPVSLAGQSGIFAGAVADEIMTRTVQKIGLGKSVHFGNKIDLDETDFTRWAWEDEKTEVIAIHIEGMPDPRRFLSLANRTKRDKPVIVLKPGRTAAGARASASHTASMALDDTIVDHAFRQYGIVRAYDLEEFVEFMKAFSYQPLPRGNRVGIVTFSGANGVMSSDELTEHGFEVVEFSEGSKRRMKEFLPEWQPAQNPLDLWAALGVTGNRNTHEEGLLSVLADENVDAVLVVLLALANAEFDGIREIYERARREYPEKPVYSVIIGGRVRDRWVNEIEGLKAPVFETTRIAVKCLAAARFYAEQRDRLQPDPRIGKEPT